MITKKIFHWFWAWQDEREEAWLSEMAKKGWHLREPGAFGWNLFEKGEPQRVAYRLDYFTDRKQRHQYLQIFQDAGWEHVGEAGSWQYFRKAALEGALPEIYTDPESKITKVQRLLGVLVVFSPIFIVMITRIKPEEGWFFSIAWFIAFVIFLLYTYAMLKLINRISQLKRSRR